ncbi:MAG TPA: tRNA lysidine(34) synthetase TilS [Gammaproteobacteria bacterium]|nr:tRNA lysidine(34) synthetase TilS [Gammaproteobacteria bacterium]
MKKLMQEYHLPPWLRDRLPLLFIDQDLACVPGIGVAEKFSVAANQPGLAIVWKQPDLRYEAKEI